jgi:hypothetical protein
VGVAALIEQRRKPMIVDFELNFLVYGVDEFVVDSVAAAGVGAHLYPLMNVGGDGSGLTT